MGTRACIARRDCDGWSGVYVHGDGGPDHLGRTLVEMVRERGADATLEHAATAPQGWTHFPDEPSAYRDEPLILTPEQDGGIEWLYLLTSDREVTVYRTEGWDDPAFRRCRRVGMIDPRHPDAGSDMAALRHVRGGADGPRAGYDGGADPTPAGDTVAGGAAPRGGTRRAGRVDERERMLWMTVRRALMMAAAAIDAYLKAPASTDT